jgi:hypothetical protein
VIDPPAETEDVVRIIVKAEVGHVLRGIIAALEAKTSSKEFALALADILERSIEQTVLRSLMLGIAMQRYNPIVADEYWCAYDSEWQRQTERIARELLHAEHSWGESDSSADASVQMDQGDH